MSSNSITTSLSCFSECQHQKSAGVTIQLNTDVFTLEVMLQVIKAKQLLLAGSGVEVNNIDEKYLAADLDRVIRAAKSLTQRKFNELE